MSYLKLAGFALIIIPLSFLTLQAQTSAQHFERGKEAIEAKNYGIAIERFTSVIELSPTNSASYYNRALAYGRLKDREKALADYTKAIQLKPDFLSAYINRAILYKDLGKPSLALADYTQAIELSPNHANAYLNRGALNLQQGYLDAALLDLNRTIELDDKLDKAYYDRGNVHTALSKWPEAIADFYSALRLDPSRTKVHYPLAWMEMHVGNNQAAYTNAVKFLETNGMDHDRTAFTLVASYLALLRDGKKTEADGFVARFPGNATPGVLPAKILNYLRGELKQEELIPFAGGDKRKLTDVRSIIGLKLLIDGEVQDARTHAPSVGKGLRNKIARVLCTRADRARTPRQN